MSRVLSTEQAKAAIRGLISTINGGFSEQITQLDNHGRTLSDPNNWDGPLAQQFRTSTWPETKAPSGPANMSTSRATSSTVATRFSVPSSTISF